jgi:hypothetical protein
MQANTEKFQAIAVSKMSFDKSPIFQIGTANISCDQVVKGSRIEPCGTPFCIFAHLLTIFPILICCFLLDK